MSENEPDLSKELPYATEVELKKRVTHYPEIPLTELVPGIKGHLVFGERLMVSFPIISPDSYFPPHRHEAEQIMIVLDGYIDEIIEGKFYRLKKGDVVILPSNIEHGACTREVDCRVIDIFSPPREDFIGKHKKTLEKSAMILSQDH